MKGWGTKIRPTSFTTRVRGLKPLIGPSRRSALLRPRRNEHVRESKRKDSQCSSSYGCLEKRPKRNTLEISTDKNSSYRDKDEKRSILPVRKVSRSMDADDGWGNDASFSPLLLLRTPRSPPFPRKFPPSLPGVILRATSKQSGVEIQTSAREGEAGWKGRREGGRAGPLHFLFERRMQITDPRRTCDERTAPSRVPNSPSLSLPQPQLHRHPSLAGL